MSKLIHLKIDNTKSSASNSKGWSNPGAKFYDTLLNSFYCKGEIPKDANELTKAIKDGKYLQWQDFLKEAYLIAPVNDINNDPHGVTPFSRSGCKYPHHEIKGDKLVLSVSGVKAAYARAKQMGIYKDDIKIHIDRHMKELGFMNKDGIHYESLINSNFIDIESSLMKLSNIDLSDDINYMNEKSHGKLKYDFRMGWDYESGHMIKVVYSLDNIEITDVGDFYYNYDGKKVGATHDSHLDYTRKNIRKKGNTDHQSKGQKVLAIVDLVTKKNLNNVKLLNPYCPGINTRATIQDNMNDIRRAANGNPDNFIHNITVGEVDNTPRFKSTHWASKVIDKSTGENLRFNKIATSEMLKHGRGQMVDNIQAKSFKIFNDEHKYMIYHNPNKKQALNELYMREKDILNYIKYLYTNCNPSDPEIENQYRIEKNNLRIIQHDIETIENGKYDLSIMKKYRSFDEAVNAGLNGRQTWHFNTYMDYRPSNESIITENTDFESNIETIQESLDWIDKFVHDEEFRENTYNIMMDRNTPQELMTWMRGNIRYGWRSITNDKLYTGNDDSGDFYNDYRLQSPTQLTKSKYGVCWDQVELERRWFTKQGIEHNVFYIEIQNQKNDPTHTFLVYSMNGVYWWFEHAWGDNMGIRKYDDLRSLIIDVVLKHQAENNDRTSPIYVSWLKEAPIFGITCQQYMNYAHSQYQLDVNNLPTSFNESVNTEYDPPLEYEKLPDHLKNDNIHSWRAKTGIELIHKEPSLEELNRIWNNWQLMTDEQKKISDEKSIELFGKDNESHYKELLLTYNSKEFINDDEFVPVYGIAASYTKSNIRNDGSIKSKRELSYMNINKILKTLSRGDNYSHSLISFDDTLTCMYSYDGKEGFMIDNIQENDMWLGTESIYICVMFIKKEDRDRMKAFIDDLTEHKEDTSYAFSNLIRMITGNTTKVDKRFVCSSFVGYMMSYSDPKNLHRDYSNIRPEDVTILPRAFYVANVRDRNDFNAKHLEIQNKVKVIYNEYKDEISDYNNHLPKLMLQDRCDKLKTVDKILNWALSIITNS